MTRPDSVTREVPKEIGDFTTTPRTILIALLAVVIGGIAAFIALALLKLINFFTNLFFYQSLSTVESAPAGHSLGFLVILVPVVGALIIGLMARYGSEHIRGHGIPEALEAILLRGSRIKPRVALLKPVSAAISIGSGGPFGAEGPIIMTGGAFGSLVAQLIHLTSVERKTLLVAGAAAGMSATFAAPVASVLLAVELLLFELKPRSLVPVALASATAALLRHFLLGAGPLFHVPPHPSFIGTYGLLGCLVIGLMAGGLSALMTASVYVAEDLFQKLKIHWMWWPALGALVVGVGGMIEPRALGVGYESIDALLHGTLPLKEIILLVVVKWTIWSVFLGSGTSGGVLAPLLMIGSALGGIVGLILPGEGAGFWPLVAMGAVLGGTMRSPLTGIIFALELTGDLNMLLPLLVAGVVAHCFTVLTMKRSILTEKVARRGYHISREYQVDPLEILSVRDVMLTSVVGLPLNTSPSDAARLLKEGQGGSLFPVVDEEGRLVRVVSRRSLEEWVEESAQGEGQPFSKVSSPPLVTTHPDEPLRVVVYKMAESGRTYLPVVEQNGSKKLLGVVTLILLLKARRHHLEEERLREHAEPLDLLLPDALLRAGNRQWGIGNGGKAGEKGKTGKEAEG